MERFSRVLTLIDHSDASMHSAEEAAKIASKFNGELHLLHISSSFLRLFAAIHPFKSNNHRRKNNRAEENRLEKTKIDLENRFRINIKTHAAEGHLKEIVHQYAKEQKIDLVVLNVKKKTGLKEFLLGTVTESIINAVDSEVLCVCPESDCNYLKKIVLPIETSVPTRKIRVAYELAKKFTASIHLVALNDTVNKSTMAQNTKVLLDAFRYLKDITNAPVECKTIGGATIAEASVEYAKKINADLILIDPGVESHWSGSLFHWWGNDIINRSSIPVLRVQSILNTMKSGLYST